MAAKVGVTPALTVMLTVAGPVAHWLAAGVKVYVVVPGVAVLMVARLQVPVIPLEEVPGKAGAVTF